MGAGDNLVLDGTGKLADTEEEEAYRAYINRSKVLTDNKERKGEVKVHINKLIEKRYTIYSV